MNSQIAAQAMNLAVQKTFKSMAEADVIMTDHALKTDVRSFGDISGEMQLHYSSGRGTIALSFPKDAIFYILGRIYHTNFVSIDESVQDGVGELLNVIGGQFRSISAISGDKRVLALPNVVVGKGHSIAEPHPVQTLVISFRVEQHTFQVYLQVA